MKDTLWAAFIGFIIAIWLFNHPWSDNTKYRRAIQECERTLPRDQQCKVIGVPDVPK